MVLETHNFAIGLLIVSQFPLRLFTNTLYGQNNASPIHSFTSSILGLGIHFLLITDTHSNAFVLVILNKLINKLIILILYVLKNSTLSYIFNHRLILCLVIKYLCIS